MGYITLLGTKGGPAIRQEGALPTASLMHFADQTVLIDCAIGATRSVVDSGTGLLDLDAIYITHLHSDHVLELGPLLYTAWTTGLGRPITVYGPEGIEEYWQGFLSAMSYDYAIRRADEGRPSLKDLVRVVTYGAGPLEDLGPLRVSALRVEHPPVTECYALKFEAQDKRVVFSSDTCYFPPLADFAHQADVLIHEAMLTAGVDRLIERTPGAKRLREHLMASHTAADEVGQIAATARVKHLVLNHLIPADDPDFGDADWQQEVAKTWNGRMTVGHDTMTITF
ncbi:MAG: MBL fold metallo-hydrolase [Rhodobacteraceae bacterium]|nr:MBL fold metallo-hydrolase [Paracoccaceae bacterium]